MEFAKEKTHEEEITEILTTLEKDSVNYKKKLNEVTDFLIESYRWNHHCDYRHSWPLLFRKQVKDIIEKTTKLDLNAVLKERDRK